MFKIKYLFLDSPISVDLEKLTKKLESLSKQGWIVTKVGPTYLKLIYQAPQNLKYQLDYLPQADALTSDQDERITNYIHLCQECGWTYIDHNQHLFIFCAGEQKEVLPLQTDVEIQNNMLISLTLKNHLLALILPTFVFWLNRSMANSLLNYTHFSGNVFLFIDVIFFILIPIYLILNLIQIIGLKRQSSFNIFRQLPIILRYTNRTILLLLITTLVLLTGCLIQENNQSPLPLLLFLSLIVLIPISMWLNTFIKKGNRSRKKNILILVGTCFLITFIMINLTIHTLFGTSQSVMKQNDDTHAPIVRLSDLVPDEKPTYHNHEFKQSSSFLLKNYVAYSDYDESYWFYSYEMRSSFMQNQFLTSLLDHYNRYGQMTKLNPLLQNSYLIYQRGELKGIIIIQNLKTYVLESQQINFLDDSIQQKILDLLNNL